MLFNLEFDSGSVIEGYVVPDGFSEQPGVRVLEDGVELAAFDCARMIEAVVQSGRHESGLVGFRVDAGVVPDIAARPRLTILDRKSGLLIYRRPQSEQTVRKRVLRLETQLLPFRRLDRMLQPHFQYWLQGAERFGEETILQAFHLNMIDSSYVSGRLMIRSYELFIEKGLEVITLLSDPYMEMAERIYLLSRLDRMARVPLGERDRMSISLAAEHFAGIDARSPKALKQALRRADDGVRNVLASPLTRQLVASYHEQQPSRTALAAAMDMLSRFAVIGLKTRPDTFTKPLSEFLGVETEVVGRPSKHQMISEIAEALRAVPTAEILLEFDLILYHFAQEAILFHHGMGSSLSVAGQEDT